MPWSSDVVKTREERIDELLTYPEAYIMNSNALLE